MNLKHQKLSPIIKARQFFKWNELLCLFSICGIGRTSHGACQEVLYWRQCLTLSTSFGYFHCVFVDVTSVDSEPKSLLENRHLMTRKLGNTGNL